jgi:hypothetical protein
MTLEVSPSFLRHWGDILIDGDLLDGFIFLEGIKCHTGFEFGGQMSSFSFHLRGRFSGLIPPPTTSRFPQQGAGSVWRSHSR